MRDRLVQLWRVTCGELSAERLVRAAARDCPEPGQGGVRRILALGKVACEMTSGALAALGPCEALAVAPEGPVAPAGVQVVRGAHPVPTEASLRGGEALLEAASRAGPEDAVLVLLSGGGSALAEALPRGISLADVRALNEALLRSGAPIEAMNVVRAHVSRLKGGGLARTLWKAGVRRALALVLVDVPQGGAFAVSSGPAAPEGHTYADALALCAQYGVALPAAVRAHLEAGGPETLRADEPAGQLVPHRVLSDMAAPARVAARLWGRGATVREALLRGPLEDFAAEAEHWLRTAPPGQLLCASGELELRVPPGAPPGGRSQHLALRLARALQGTSGAALAAGTDGRDGPTDAAGAAVDGASWIGAIAEGLDPAAALAQGAASPLLTRLGVAIPAQPTGAHAGDLVLLAK